MDDKKITSFIKQLSKDTLDNKIYWKRLTDYQGIKPTSNKPIFNMLFETEFRHIEFSTSYYAIVNNGEIYLLNELTISGRSGTINSGYKVYLHSEASDKVSYLSCDAALVFQLINSIHSYLASEEADAESFIDDFLSQH